MAADYGIAGSIEAWMVETLAALTANGEPVFKTAEIWKHQIGAINAGAEAFARFSPFAFVAFMSADAFREGGYDLRQSLVFRVAFGLVSKADGVARAGDANNLGALKIRDLIVAALDGKQPDGISCDLMYYTGDVEMIDRPKRYAMQMHFKVNYL